MPSVTVVMPAFNAARYISPAIDSVRRQTIRDLELLVVDDGSTDETVEIVRHVSNEDPRVKLIVQANAGPGPARNAGFRAAAGGVFAFLDSDDEWAPDFLEAQLAILSARPDIHVVIGNAWNRGGPADGLPARPRQGNLSEIPLAAILADETALFIMAVFRREVVDAIGGFDPALLTNEEYDLWIRASLAGFRLARNPEPLGWYACRDDSLSSSDERMVAGILRVFAKTHAALPEGCPERAIIDRQVARFEGELAALRARASFAAGDYSAARRHLADLYARRGGALLGLAVRLPFAAAAAYRVRERLRRAWSTA
jgi:glycosyltransferase involved in cell wall biosynthesis